jgi:hypothetical protein
VTASEAKKQPRFVRYVGTADLRKISRADWKQAGVASQADVVWNHANGFKVLESDLSEEALALLDPAEFKTA